MRLGVLLCRERPRISLAAAEGATMRMWRQLGDHRHGARWHELTSSCRGLPPWRHSSGVLEGPLNAHVRVDVSLVLKGQCLHASYDCW
jgi:hypothetical protein